MHKKILFIFISLALSINNFTSAMKKTNCKKNAKNKCKFSRPQNKRLNKEIHRTHQFNKIIKNNHTEEEAKISEINYPLFFKLYKETPDCIETNGAEKKVYKFTPEGKETKAYRETPEGSKKISLKDKYSQECIENFLYKVLNRSFLNENLKNCSSPIIKDKTFFNLIINNNYQTCAYLLEEIIKRNLNKADNSKQKNNNI